MTPRTITVDKNPAYPSASKSMKKARELSRFARLRQVKYLTDVEQNHRRIKRMVRPGLGFKSMSTARRIVAGYEIFAMIRKGRVASIPANDVGSQRIMIASLFAIAALSLHPPRQCASSASLQQNRSQSPCTDAVSATMSLLRSSLNDCARGSKMRHDLL